MGLDHDKLKKRRAGSRAGTGWKPREGPNRVRFLPPNTQVLNNWDLLEDLAVQFKMHFFRIEGRPTEVSRCLEEVGQRCPACAMWRMHRKSTDPGLKEMANKVAPADQYLFNVLDLNNLAAGIQSYTANYTVWDKVMEVGSNPAWGNILDPANGVDFEITLTPGTRSRSGFNAYSVTPSPQRTSVLEILEAIPEWESIIDALPGHITAAKNADEIVGLLNEMGFPPLGGSTATAPAPSGARPAPAAAAPRPAAPAPAAPRPAAAPAPVAPRPAGVSVPGAGAPRPVAPRPAAAPAPAPAQHDEAYEDGEPAPSAPVPAAPRGGPASARAPRAALPHYDPGPQYVNPNAGTVEMPAGAPRCYSDYDTDRHECSACPVVVDCQFQMMTLA